MCDKNIPSTSRNQCETSEPNLLLSNLDDSEDYDIPDELINYKIDTTRLRSDENYKGFDNNSGDSWIYPTNYPVRKYQYEITRVALFTNTLVVLPTGLGKTFLAAVVMYNFYRWYPRGKVIFMAPTRPLVAQQIEACYQIMGIPKEDTIELTGKQQKANRKIGWKTKRVFFVTPQVLASDLNESDFPVDSIKLIVVDEAHKASGKYAYVEVVQKICQKNVHFRILALSATPGRKLEDVGKIVKNLLISKIEVRTEDSPDVSPYTFKRNIKTVTVKMNQELRDIKSELIEIADPYVSSLLDYKIINGSLNSLTKNWLIMQQKRFQDMSRQQRHPNHSDIMGNFSMCVSLYHIMELLERHGIQIFLNYFDSANDGKECFLARDPEVMTFVNKIREQYGLDKSALTDDAAAESIDFGHPKYEVLRKHLVEHFQQNKDTRSIVFCEFRESVYLIDRLLRSNRPLIRSGIFVGKRFLVFIPFSIDYSY